MQGRENLSRYAFNHKVIDKTFCKICGVHFANEWLDVTQEHLDSLPEEARKFREGKLEMFPINSRVFDDFSLDGLKITVNPGTHGKPYVNP